MKEIKDIIHLYLGVECQTPWGILKLSYFDMNGRYKAWFNDGYEENKNILDSNNVKGRSFNLTEFKLILRPLSSITEEEKKEYKYLLDKQGYMDITWEEETPQSFLFLISKHFDLFNLIESGLAIDKNNQP